MLAIIGLCGRLGTGSGGRKAAGFMRKPFFINDLGCWGFISLFDLYLRLIAAVFCQELPLPSVNLPRFLIPAHCPLRNARAVEKCSQRCVPIPAWQSFFPYANPHVAFFQFQLGRNRWNCHHRRPLFVFCSKRSTAALAFFVISESGAPATRAHNTFWAVGVPMYSRI